MGPVDKRLTSSPIRRTVRLNGAAGLGFLVEAMGLEPTNLLTASQALYQLSYAPSGGGRI